MKTITFDNPHRKKHFEFFKGMNHPHFGITANVDITALLPYIKANKLRTSTTIVYLISKAANAITEFRWRIRENEIVEHEKVHPSFTVPTQEADVFSFCTVEFNANAQTFLQNAKKQIDAMYTNPSFEDEEGRDDYLFLSAMPWVSFTGLQHAMHYHPGDSVPRITWGKFFEQNEKIVMPVSVQAHHALVDGRHVGQYYELLEEIASDPEKYMK